MLIRGLPYLAGFIEAVNYSTVPWQITLLFRFSKRMQNKINRLLLLFPANFKTHLRSRVAYFAFRVARSFIANDIAEYPRWFVSGVIVSGV